MKQNYLKNAAWLLSIPVLLSGCVDNNYDLDDIDTTTRIPVTDLTIPLNLKSILLDDVLDLSDNENISVSEANGKKIYAIEKSGTIEYDNISIAPVHINAPSINSTQISLQASGLPIPAPAHANSDWADLLTVKYNIDSEMLTTVRLSTQGIDPALVSVDKITSSRNIELNIKFTLPRGLANNVGKLRFSNVTLQLPKGLYLNGNSATLNFGTYDPATGKAVLNHEVNLSGNNIVEIRLTADMLKASEAGFSIVDHSINFAENTGLLTGGYIALTPKFDNITLDNQFTLTGDYDLTSFDIKTVSGEVDYNVSGIDIDPIDLSNLPDFLADPETNILLNNPQIYLGVTNPTADYDTGLSGKVVLESVFKNGAVNQPVSPEFSIGWNRGPVRYNVALASDPSQLNLIGRFPNPDKYVYNGLNTLLSDPNQTDGLPKTIHVALDGLRFHGHATDFPIRQNDNSNFGVIPAVEGEYSFYAPLAMDLGSTIVYAKTEDEIGSEDIDKITINKLTLNAQAQTNLPYNIRIDLAVFNKDGKQVGKCTKALELKPNANGPIVLTVESTPDSPITDIDAIQYRARIVSTGDTRPLSPDQFIKLNDIRLSLDGYIQTDF